MIMPHRVQYTQEMQRSKEDQILSQWKYMETFKGFLECEVWMECVWVQRNGRISRNSHLQKL